eukprot:849300-Pleurochrysis_carterae.AAC.2
MENCRWGAAPRWGNTDFVRCVHNKCRNVHNENTVKTSHRSGERVRLADVSASHEVALRRTTQQRGVTRGAHGRAWPQAAEHTRWISRMVSGWVKTSRSLLPLSSWVSGQSVNLSPA